MSQPRTHLTISKSAISDRSTENCSEASLTKTVTETARKSSRRRILPFKLRKGEEKVEEPESTSASKLEGQLLGLDDLIDDFGDDEYSESAEEVTQSGIDLDTVNEET